MTKFLTQVGIIKLSFIIKKKKKNNIKSNIFIKKLQFLLNYQPKAIAYK